MKKLHIILLLFVCSVFLNCKNSNAQADNNSIVFLEYVNHIEDSFIKEKTQKGFNISEAILKIEDISNIKSYMEEGYSDYKIPNQWNIKDWKDWYDLNKSNLRFDKEKEKFYLDSDIKYLRKNPVEVFKVHLSILKKNNGIENENINANHLDYAITFFENLTGYKKIELEEDWGERIPKQSDIDFLNNWLDQNKGKLSWDEKNQEVKIK
ncbi:hypothetical protein [uncultured Dokdonia sp.]|uniref:hypothetical protein n=1 Tax=uncultured Dokdonia sp. TaxID=575653 RepID=UPI0026130C75|nr:hypothetical protein [uncultured Dokdonia sp.]